MKDLFSFYFFNPPHEDSILFAQQLNAKDDILFDLGNCSRIPAALLLRVRWVFISHTHIDHFCGFPHFLRVILKIPGKTVDLFGPEGFTKNIEGALSSYQWNLLDNYCLKFIAHEVFENRIIQTVFDSKNRFMPSDTKIIPLKDKILVENELFCVKTGILNHKTPVLGFRLEGKNQLAVNKDSLLLAGEKSGPWLGEAKKLTLKGGADDTIIQTSLKKMSLAAIIKQFFVYKKKAAYAYLTDFGFTRENIETAVNLAKGTKKLFIESNFLHEDKKNALETCHLTAYQAGLIASMAKAEQVKLFHFSQRYLKNGQLFESLFYNEMEQGKKAGEPDNETL